MMKTQYKEKPYYPKKTKRDLAKHYNCGNIYPVAGGLLFQQTGRVNLYNKDIYSLLHRSLQS